MIFPSTQEFLEIGYWLIEQLPIITYVGPFFVAALLMFFTRVAFRFFS